MKGVTESQVEEVKCEGCGQYFKPNKYNPTQHFCSGACRSKTWQRKAIEERRCLRCGQPSSKTYKTACKEHIGVSRLSHAKKNHSRREKLKSAGLCEQCGKVERDLGYQTCTVCRAKKAIRQQLTRYDRRVDDEDYLQSKLGLVTLTDAALLIGCSMGTISYLVREGYLVVGAKRFRHRWVELGTVNHYQQERLRTRYWIVGRK